MRVDKTLREIILPRKCGRDKLVSGSVQESPLCQAEEKGLAGSKGQVQARQAGRPHAETPSLTVTNTAVDNLSFRDLAQHC